jgi:Putative Ig domain
MTVYTKPTNTSIIEHFTEYFPEGSTLSTNLSSSTSLSVFTINGNNSIDISAVNVAYGTTVVSVIVILDDPFAIYAITGDSGLKTGSNTLTVDVTAQDGTQTPYNIAIIVDHPLEEQPTISDFTIPLKTYGIDVSFQLVAPSSNSSGTFIYTSSDTNVATIFNATVTILKVGKSTITATQLATTRYASASKTALLTVHEPTIPPYITSILPNKIIGKYAPNSRIVITEKTTNNRIITNQIQSDNQGTWDFKITTPANNYSFSPADVNQLVTTIASNYSFTYPHPHYILRINSPVSINPRQYGTNEQDQRSFRISPKLPEGLKFSPITGVISGTPVSTMESTTYTVWSNSEVFLSYKRQLTVEIV